MKRHVTVAKPDVSLACFFRLHAVLLRSGRSQLLRVLEEQAHKILMLIIISALEDVTPS